MIPLDPAAMDFLKYHVINMEMFQELDQETQITVLRLVEEAIKLYMEGLYITKDDGQIQ